MDPIRFDHLTQTLAAGASRRRVLLALAGGILGRLPMSTRAAAGPLAQTATPTPVMPGEGSGLFPSPYPIPIGGDQYLVDGSIISLDLEAAAIVEATPALPIQVGEETVIINPGALVSPGQPGATPTAEGPEGDLESLCGFDDSQDVELYDGTLGVSREFVAGHQPPVGCIRWNTNLGQIFQDAGTVNGWRWCSGTLIAPDLFLTAGHCFSQFPPGWRVPRVQGTNDPISRTEIALNMHIDFRYQLDAQGNDQLPVSFPIVDLVEDSLGNMDYAIVRVANNPGLTFGIASISPVDAAEGDMLCIMGHPSGVPKRIEAGPLSRFGPVSIEYDDIDTRPVSSGSGILADATKQIVGVHTNGGCCEITEEEDCLEPEPGRNVGVRISALLQHSPLLLMLATGGESTA